MSPRLRFPIFLLSVATILIVAPLFQQGLFIDGLLYKTVAYNYFQNEGSFWRMKFTDVSMNPFYEQPPLYFFITGCFYKLFGTTLVADRFLTLFLLFCTVFLIRKCCKILFGENNPLFLIAVLFLLSIQVVCWSYVNQMIEILVMLFSLFCLFLFLKSTERNEKKHLPYIISFGLTVPLLFLTKGFQSCFIIALPFFHSVVLKNRASLVFGIFSAVISSTILYLLLFRYSPSAQWFSHYFQKRLLASLNNVGATTDNHFEIIIRIFTELIFPLAVTAVLFFRNKNLKLKNNKMAWVLLFTAVAGSFPFAITLEQRGFYLVPSFPFYILALLVIFRNHFSMFSLKIQNLFNNRTTLTVVYLSFFGATTYWIYSFKLYKRDENLIKDLSVIETHIQKNDTISILEESWNNVPLHGYLFMHTKNNLEVNQTHALLIHDRTISEKPDTTYNKIELPTFQYDLYKKIHSEL